MCDFVPIFAPFKRLVLLTASLSILLFSCGTVVYTVEATTDSNVIRKTKNSRTWDYGNRCHYKETIWFEDTLTQTILSKEINTYNCRGAYTALVDSKKWTLENNRLVRQK